MIYLGALLTCYLVSLVIPARWKIVTWASQLIILLLMPSDLRLPFSLVVAIQLLRFRRARKQDILGSAFLRNPVAVIVLLAGRAPGAPLTGLNPQTPVMARFDSRLAGRLAKNPVGEMERMIEESAFRDLLWAVFHLRERSVETAARHVVNIIQKRAAFAMLLSAASTMLFMLLIPFTALPMLVILRSLTP